MGMAARLRRSAAGNGVGGAVEAERRWEWRWRRGYGEQVYDHELSKKSDFAKVKFVQRPW